MTCAILRPATALVLIGCLAIAGAIAAQPAGGAEGKASTTKTTKKKIEARRGKVRHRLPPNYGKVVTDEQREKIYKIQDEYRPKIEALRAQLKALLKERNEKIEALLTPEQKQKITEAKAKRKAQRTKPKKPNDAPAGD